MVLRNTQYRHCSRCGLPLEDLASQEAGVGPICRKKDNALFAKTITGNLGLALALATTIDGLHEECLERFNVARDKFVKNFSNLVTDNALEGKAHGIDARELAKACDFACSFVHPGGFSVRNQLIELIRHLGYVGLAGVISGEASTGAAKVWFDSTDGRIKLTGSSNTHGWRAMRRIPGVQLPRYRGDKTPYSCGPAHVKDFLGYVIRFWPIAEGDLESIVVEAQKYSQANASVSTAATAPTATGPFASQAIAYLDISERACKLSFVWDRNLDVRGMIAELKAKVPYRFRSYEPVTKSWIFHTNQLETVQQIVSKTYTNLVIRT